MHFLDIAQIVRIEQYINIYLVVHTFKKAER